MKIIGHRGAASLAPENTISSIKKAIEVGVDGLEFDIRLTKDRRVVLCHDAELGRVSGDLRDVSQLNWDELKKIILRGDEHVPLLEDVLKIVGTTPVIIEIKDKQMVRLLLEVLDRFPHLKVTVASFKHDEIALLKQLRPHLPAYIASQASPFEIMQKARIIGADGVDISFWLLNPFTYWFARHLNLDLMVYTVDHLWLGLYMRVFYPKVLLTTNVPQKMQHLRSKH